MPENPITVKTIVTTDIVKKIAEKYNVEVIEVLTGFKFIGEQIGPVSYTHLYRQCNNSEYGFLLLPDDVCSYHSGSYHRLCCRQNEIQITFCIHHFMVNFCLLSAGTYGMGTGRTSRT